MAQDIFFPNVTVDPQKVGAMRPSPGFEPEQPFFRAAPDVPRAPLDLLLQDAKRALGEGVASEGAADTSPSSAVQLIAQGASAGGPTARPAGAVVGGGAGATGGPLGSSGGAGGGGGGGGFGQTLNIVEQATNFLRGFGGAPPFTPPSFSGPEATAAGSIWGPGGQFLGQTGAVGGPIAGTEGLEGAVSIPGEAGAGAAAAGTEAGLTTTAASLQAMAGPTFAAILPILLSMLQTEILGGGDYVSSRNWAGNIASTGRRMMPWEVEMSRTPADLTALGYQPNPNAISAGLYGLEGPQSPLSRGMWGMENQMSALIQAAQAGDPAARDALSRVNQQGLEGFATEESGANPYFNRAPTSLPWQTPPQNPIDVLRSLYGRSAMPLADVLSGYQSSIQPWNQMITGPREGEAAQMLDLNAYNAWLATQLPNTQSGE